MRAIDYFDKGADIDPDRLAIVEGETKYTFREVRELTFRIAAAMRADGLKRQEPVAIFGPNHAKVLICLLSVWRASQIWIPMNARNAIDANVAYMSYVGVQWLFYHSSLAEDVKQLKARVPTLTRCICLDRADLGDPMFEDWMKLGDGKVFDEDVDCFGNLKDIVGIFPTGGTTGPAKGVMVNNVGWGAMQQTAHTLWSEGGVKDPVCLTTAPLTHAAGPVSLAASSFGATNVIMSGFHAGQVLRNIEKYKVTHIYVPPTALYSLLDHPNVRSHDYSSLKVMLLVGSPVSPGKLKLAVDVFGPSLCQCYGQVEAPMIMTWLPAKDVAAAAAGDRPERLASCGKPTASVRLAILDDKNEPVKQGEPGEICVRGSLVSQEYFGMPEATAEAHAGGWHHTGDVGYRDVDGYVYIVDRKKDMIITGGYNVFSAEVEGVLMEMPSVREAAVVGVPDERWGEAIKAVVVKSDGANVDAEQVIAFCRAKLGGVKAPKSVEFWDDIPKTPNNKFDKKAIRAKFWGDTGRNVN